MAEHTLIWIDLEMTGVELEKDVILEIATVITDDNLEVVAHGPNLAIHQPDAVLYAMNQWCKEQHAKSGLIEAVQKSSINTAQAETQTIDFIKTYCPAEKGILCGSSVWQDRNFLKKYMPSIITYLYYKLIDVSSVQQLVKRWYPKNPLTNFVKQDTHRALPDVFESIEELRHYRKHFFV